jgi:L-amino acid N-acyltransferase YncA
MVAPDAFGGGVGAAMGEHSLGEARRAGFRAMQFNAVVSTNARAVALWRRLGFAVVGTVPGAFAHREHGYVDLLIMHRVL